MRRLSARHAAIAILAGLACALLGPLGAAASDDLYIVQEGDNLPDIAYAYGLDVNDLVRWNEIENPTLIYPGDMLVLHDPAQESVEPDEALGTGGGLPTYFIEWGDTIEGIAARFGVSVAALAEANALDDPDWLLAGDQLVIPARMPKDDPRDDPSTFVEEPPYVDPVTIAETLETVAHLYGWNPALVEAVAWQESRWTHNGVSWAGAIGVMQVLPQTAAEVGDWYLGRDVDPWNSVWDNIEAGVAYLTILYDATGGDIEQTLAAYYQGLGSVQRDGWFLDTEEYVSSVLRYRDQFMAGVLP